MKAAIIAPIKYLNDYCTLTDCQLCHAHLILENSSYRDFYIDRVKRGNLVVMDCAFQIPRKALGGNALVEAVSHINPTYLVLPDTDFSYEKTVQASLDFVSRVKVKTVGVLQGYDIKTLGKTYRALRAHCDLIGLPHSNEKVMKREWIIRKLKIQEPCFYLGTYSNPLEEVPVDSNVIGVSSDFPVRLGLDLRKLTEGYPEPLPLDFYLETISMPELVMSNIHHFLDLCSEAD